MVKLLLKFLKTTGLISKILPGVLRAWAEGGLGEPARKVYWWLEGYKTVTGALLMGLGAGLEHIAPSFPEWTWVIPFAKGVFWLGGMLSSIGLVDAGVRAPWPTGTKIEAKDKR